MQAIMHPNTIQRHAFRISRAPHADQCAFAFGCKGKTWDSAPYKKKALGGAPAGQFARLLPLHLVLTSCGMCANYIELGMLVVQALGLIGLAIYCVETSKIRKASQEQVSASQRLIKAAMDQVEGTLKPCIAFVATLRDGADAILDMHGAVGNLVVQADQGNYVIQNIGNGAALNLRYFFTRPDVPQPDWRYLPALVPPARATLIETLGFYNREHVTTFEYESIGGRKYRSTITINHHVITAFAFQEIVADTECPA